MRVFVEASQAFDCDGLWALIDEDNSWMPIAVFRERADAEFAYRAFKADGRAVFIRAAVVE